MLVKSGELKSRPHRFRALADKGIREYEFSEQWYAWQNGRSFPRSHPDATDLVYPLLKQLLWSLVHILGIFFMVVYTWWQCLG